jgi:long-chain acyl-CoA synthetase
LYVENKRIMIPLPQSYKLLYQTLRKCSNNDIDINETTHLSSLFEMNSLKRLELASALEDAYKIEISEELLHARMTVSDVREVLASGSSDNEKIVVNLENFRPRVQIIRSVLQYTLLPLSRFLFSFNVEGLENLNGVTSVHIFALNHESHLDSPTFVKAVPYRIRKRLAFAAATDVFYTNGNTMSLQQKFLELSLNIFPFSRKGSLRKSIQNCIDVLSAGYHVCIYPEGKRTTDGTMMEFKSGVGILVSKAQVPVVPVRIHGLFSVLKKGQSMPKFGKVTVKIGKPIVFQSSQSYIDIARSIQEQVQKL